MFGIEGIDQFTDFIILVEKMYSLFAFHAVRLKTLQRVSPGQERTNASNS